MTNKQIFIIISITLVVLLIGAGIFSYYYNRTPKEITKKTVILDQKDDNIDKYLTQNFINQIRDSGASDKDFLEENVDEYDVKESIESIDQKTTSEREATVEITMKTITTDLKTNFAVTTMDKYEAKLTKVGGDWKMDSYTLIESATVR